jgi:hypothetical protein
MCVHINPLGVNKNRRKRNKEKTLGFWAVDLVKAQSNFYWASE